MSGHEGSTQKLAPPAARQPGAPVIDRAAWWQLGRNVAYVLAAGPRGLGYLAVLAITLLLDLLHMLLRMLVAGALTLLEIALHGLRWLGWLGFRMLIVWPLRMLGRLLIGLGRLSVRLITLARVGLAHPGSAWQRLLRRERYQVDVRRTRRLARVGSITGRWGWRRVGRTYRPGPTLQRFQRRSVPARWLVAATIWRLVLRERQHTVRWLRIDLPPLEPPGTLPSDLALLPPASVGYTLARLPLGLLALALAGTGVAVGVELIDSHQELLALLPALVSVAALHLLALASGRFAQRAFQPSVAVLRLQAAESLAAQARDAAERAEQSRRDLIINVGHELRTPTASILGHVESVLLALEDRDAHMPPETLRSYLAIVQREAERLSLLVDDLLAVARSERSELQLLIAPVDADAVICEVHQALAPLARRDREVMLICDVPPGLPLLLADRQRLTQVLLNLVRNAITYTPAGGIVSIAAGRAAPSHLRITVADTGSGIAPDDLERVFERFYRADASRARSSGGFGLGLAIARDLVEAMSGTITADSVVGEGSSFHVVLPVATGDRDDF